MDEQTAPRCANEHKGIEVKARTLIVLLLLVAIAAGYGLYWLGMNRGMKMATPTAGESRKPGDSDPADGKKVLYWHDPMVPGQKFDKPGKSPFMDMQLVPVYAGGETDEGRVSISPRVQQNLGVRTAEVTSGAIQAALQVVGSVAFNERDVAVVEARTNAYVERLHVRAPLDTVRKGQALAELYAPDWVAAQEEYLTVKRMASESASIASLLGGARQRMRLAGMTEDHIRLIESTGKVHPRLIVTAPLAGVIGELSAREGMTVMSGAPLFRINGLGTVWINAELPEGQAAFVRPGSAVEARTQAFPDSVFKGRVQAILPEVNAATRTLKVRVEIANKGGRLAPGMFAIVDFTPLSRKEVLLVPTEAVIQTGRRSVVIVVQNDGTFKPVDVEIGSETNGQTEIRKGLEAGQKVVVSGQFLLDSEASLRASTTRMGPADASTAPAAKAASDGAHRGEGKVESLGKGEVTLSHGPMPSLKWPPMTMGFKVAPENVPKGLKPGDTVTFEVRQKDDAYEVVKMEPKK